MENTTKPSASAAIYAVAKDLKELPQWVEQRPGISEFEYAEDSVKGWQTMQFVLTDLRIKLKFTLLSRSDAAFVPHILNLQKFVQVAAPEDKSTHKLVSSFNHVLGVTITPFFDDKGVVLRSLADIGKQVDGTLFFNQGLYNLDFQPILEFKVPDGA